MARSGSASGADGPRPGDRVRVAVFALDAAMRGVGQVHDFGPDQDVGAGRDVASGQAVAWGQKVASGQDVAPRLRPTEVSIAGALPGDVVEVEVEHVDRRGRAFGRLLRVLEASADRVESPCARFLDCSGCDLLTARVELQHAEKRAGVARVLGVPVDDVDPVIASPRPLGYRALAKLVVGPDLRLGSYRARSHDVADMRGCVVHAPEVERVVDALRAALVDSHPAGEGAPSGTPLRYVLVRASLAEGQALVTLVTRSGGPTAQAEVTRLAAHLEAREDVAAVYHHVNDSSGDELLGPGPHTVVFERARPRERILEVVHTLGSGAFAQVNPGAAERLYARAVELARPMGVKVLDLYSGSAGLALQLAKAGAARVTGVESSPAAVVAARHAARENGLAERVTVLELRAEEALDQLAGERWDVVVLNPPRKGAARGVLEGIARLGPERVVYVSCNPETLARDLAILREMGGFQLRRVTPVDLFPGTRHVETVALVERTRRESR